MSRTGSISLDWAGERYEFRLAWGELVKLQEACDAGPFVVLDRLLHGRWRVEEIANVIRLGLIGGGMDASTAHRKVRIHVEGELPLENLVFAQKILGAAIMGVPEEAVGKKSEAASPDPKSDPSQTESSDLPPSTETAL